MAAKRHPEIMYNYLHGTDIWLYQRSDMFRVNTDTCLLAEFMKVKPGEVVLDIGTNNGALLLYASQFQPRRLIGVDIWEEAIALAACNVKHNHIENVDLITGRVQNLVLPQPVDVIICNPPYFPVGPHMNESAYLRTARHEVNLTFDELCEAVSRLLAPDGRWYLVHRASREQQLIAIGRRYGLYPYRIQRVRDEAKPDELTAVLIAWSRCDREIQWMPNRMIQR